MSVPEIDPLASPPLATPWVPLWPVAPVVPPVDAGKEIIRVEFATVSFTTGPVVVVTLVVPCDGGKIDIEFYSPSVSPAAAANHWVNLTLYEDGVSLGGFGTIQNAGNYGCQVPVASGIRRQPAAGNHTYRVDASSSGSAANVYGGPPSYVPGYIRALRV